MPALTAHGRLATQDVFGSTRGASHAYGADRVGAAHNGKAAADHQHATCVDEFGAQPEWFAGWSKLVCGNAVAERRVCLLLRGVHLRRSYRVQLHPGERLTLP